MTVKSVTKLVLGALAAAWLSSAPAAQADEFPSKQMTFVVPYAPGGISDILGRAVSASLEEQFGVPVVVVNKPSPGIVLGLNEVASARPDGYTIGIWSNSAYVFPMSTGTEVPYDGIDSFTFVRSYGEFVLGVVVKEDSPYKTFDDLIAAGKEKPGALKYGSVGVNSGQHLMIVATEEATGAKFTHIPQTGTAAGVANVLGGHLDFLSDASSWAPQVKQGQLRLLAVTGAERNPYFPDAPTFKEAGVEAEYWGRGAIVAAAGIPPEVRAKLSAALDKAFQSPKVKEAVAMIAQNIVSIPGEDMEAWAKKDRETWSAIFKK